MKLLTFAVLALAPTFALSAEAIRLEMLQGAKEITAKRGQTSIKLKEGDALQPKDELTTGPKESARIVFADGSQLWVGYSTSVQINSAATDAGHRIQLIVMKEGSGRILVPRTYGTTKKIKFVVKTQAATMGVRGTDFVVDAHDSGKDVELHTLEGSVETGKSIKALIQKDTVPVGGGFTIHATDANPIPQPKNFDVSKFTTDLNQRQPAFVAYSLNPVTQPQEQAPSAPQSNANPNSAQGIKAKVEQMMKNRENELDKH